MVRAALAGALDRAVDVAAALEVRGYALAGRPRAAPPAVVAPRPPCARRGAPAIVGGRDGRARWPAWRRVDTYPTLRDRDSGPAELALARALVLLGAAPFAGRAARMGVARA